MVFKLTFIGFHLNLIFSILLLAEGRTAYMGSTAEALTYFRRYILPNMWLHVFAIENFGFVIKSRHMLQVAAEQESEKILTGCSTAKVLVMHVVWL